MADDIYFCQVPNTAQFCPLTWRGVLAPRAGMDTRGAWAPGGRCRRLTERVIFILHPPSGCRFRITPAGTIILRGCLVTVFSSVLAVLLVGGCVWRGLN